MQSAKKMKALSILSMAAAATLGAKASHAAVLSLYYDNITVDGVPVYNYGTDPGYTNTPTTITIGIGDTFAFGIDAVVTNNVNGDAGKKTGAPPGKTILQPSYLGLSTLSIVVPSSDTTGSKLAPVLIGGPQTTIGGLPDYSSFESLNNGVQSAQGNNSGTVTFVPVWNSNTPGDVQPTSPTHGGDVGDNFAIFQGNGALPNSNAGASTLAQYGAKTGSYATATDFFDSLSYTGTHAGTVVLSPVVDQTGTSYWALTTHGTASTASGYIATSFGAGANDLVGTLPVLVINIKSAAQPIISLGLSTDTPPATYGTSQGDLQVIPEPGHGHYQPGYKPIGVVGVGIPTSYVQVTGYTPESDEEIYALDVLVNGVEANPAQIQLLINAIDGDGQAPASAGVAAASNTWAGLAPLVTGANPFLASESVSPFNLYLDMGNAVEGSGLSTYFGWDVSSQDSNLVGYSIEEVATVPEPMTLGLLALGGLGLMSRRHRRKV